MLEANPALEHWRYKCHANKLRQQRIMSARTSLTPFQLKSLDLFCRALASDRKLRTWFASLATLPSNLRANAIMQISNDMRRNQEDNGLIGAICSISDPDVYAAATEAVNAITR